MESSEKQVRQVRQPQMKAGSAALQLRPMRVSDVTACESIDAEAFPHSLWGRETFLTNVTACYDLAFVAEAEGRVCGFAIMRVLGDEAELLLIAVETDLRGRGIGAALLNRLTALSEGRGAKKFFLEVRAGNEAAIRLYRKAGFQEIGLRKRYYHEPEEDAVLMRRDINAV